jgi:hypothetical protein
MTTLNAAAVREALDSASPASAIDLAYAPGPTPGIVQVELDDLAQLGRIACDWFTRTPAGPPPTLCRRESCQLSLPDHFRLINGLVGVLVAMRADEIVGSRVCLVSGNVPPSVRDELDEVEVIAGDGNLISALLERIWQEINASQIETTPIAREILQLGVAVMLGATIDCFYDKARLLEKSSLN